MGDIDKLNVDKIIASLLEGNDCYVFSGHIFMKYFTLQLMSSNFLT